MTNSFERARRAGFIFPEGRAWINKNDPARMAQDAALVSTANTLVPAEFTAFVDPMIIEILTAKRNARAVFAEAKKGDFATAYEKFPVEEFTGATTEYDDYSNAAVAGVNFNWPTREQYRFQTTLNYGDLESAVMATAKINLASKKQQAAARIIDVDANKFYLYGVNGRAIYGMLNDPNLPAAITPGTAAATGTTWSVKTTKEIFEDVLKLYAALQTSGQGNIDMDSDLCLLVPPALSVQLGKATDFNVSVQKMIDDYFKGGKLEIILLPELHNASTSINTIMMIARNIMGTPTAQLAFSEKIRAGRVVPAESSFRQKYSSTTYGCIYYRYFGVAQMTGV